MQELTVRCSAIDADGRFQLKHTGRGSDLSPEFHLQGLRPEAATLAVILEDITHPLFRNFTHWITWNLPVLETIPGALPRGKRIPGLGSAEQGIGYGFFRYAGPKPPRGSRHTYRFTVFVLDDLIAVPLPFTKRSFLRCARGHILQQACIEGYCQP
ncbi:MAG: YbhB/YbcL family Raf kinase inhibitor-like protein [Clostridia bacterium]|nr:YbhB/YbcL family Raf kinase inhibitor-like protein [Clostridia bacterium]